MAWEEACWRKQWQSVTWEEEKHLILCVTNYLNDHLHIGIIKKLSKFCIYIYIYIYIDIVKSWRQSNGAYPPHHRNDFVATCRLWTASGEAAVQRHCGKRRMGALDCLHDFTFYVLRYQISYIASLYHIYIYLYIYIYISIYTYKYIYLHVYK